MPLAYAEAHGVPNAYDSYQALCEDPDVDIVYIASKTWAHHRDLLTAINAGKHVLCEKPFTDTAAQAREVYEAADKAGVFCQEGMWTRCFPAIEHARAILERGDIGDLKLVQADYPDRVYALNPAVETPSHHPSALTVSTGRPPREGTREAEGKPVTELDPSEGWVGDWRATHWNPDRNPTHGAFNHVERFNYPLPTPAPITRGQPAGSRWTGERFIRYKGWTWSGGNQHGFMYQAQAVHRCMAAGLKELPQFTRAESIRVCEIIDEINRQCAEIGF